MKYLAHSVAVVLLVVSIGTVAQADDQFVCATVIPDCIGSEPAPPFNSGPCLETYRTHCQAVEAAKSQSCEQDRMSLDEENAKLRKLVAKLRKDLRKAKKK